MTSSLRSALLALMVLLGSSARAQDSGLNPFASVDEAQMLQAWASTRQLPVGLARAILLAEGAADGAQLAASEGRLESLFSTLDREVQPRHDDARKARTIFRYLHANVLRQYRKDARFAETLESGTFNCVTGTFLFYLAAERYGIPTQVFVTPNHVFAAVTSGTKRIKIEMTDPRRGFDFKDDYKAVVEHLVAYKIVLPEEVQARGARAVYTELIERSRPVEAPAFLSIAYGNRAAFYLEANEPDAAFFAYDKALRANPDYAPYRLGFEIALEMLAQRHSSDAVRFEPYLRHALEVRSADTTFAGEALPFVARAADGLSRARRFDLAAALVEAARTSFGEHRRAELDAVEAELLLMQGASLYNRGEYEAADRAGARAYALAPSDPRVEESYVMFSCRRSAEMAENGEAQAAFAKLDSVQRFSEDYAVYRDTYARVTVYAVHRRGGLMSQDRYEEARALMLRALEVAPEAGFLREAIAPVYHELAMVQVRAKKHDAARALVDEGLRHAPGSEVLEEAYGIIEEFKRNRW